MKEDLEINYWAVAFIDLLGQNDLFQQMTHIPKTENENKHFKNLFQKTFAAVNYLHNSFETTCCTFNKKHPQTQLPPEITEEQFAKLRTGKVRIQRFSDGLVLFVSLANKSETLPMNGISSLLATLGIIFPELLSMQIPLRCGIDIGIGMEMNPNELYGPAVRNAYYLESKIAQYPRIVLGKEIIGYMKDYIPSLSDNTQENNISTALAKHWINRCCIDVDGYTILDYLGSNFLADAKGKEAGKDVYEKAFGFIISELKKHKINQDTKLAFRYVQLHDYFESRRKNWLE